MKILIATFFGFFLFLRDATAYELPPEVINGVANDSWGSNFEPALSSRDLKNYFAKNWRNVAANIELLPTHKIDPKHNKERLIPIYSTFYESCEILEPDEYVDFIDQMLLLYEQKRVSDLFFEGFLMADFEKQDFLSVNFEHPRVAAFLKKAISLVPPEDESLRSCLEDMANGTLADDYMVNRSDDGAKPQTLPGIKLKRPWDSLIRKYERATGKKLPPAPDFPEDAERPSKRAGHKGESGFDDVESSATNHSSGLIYWIGLPFLALLGVFVWLKKSKRNG